MNKFLASIHTPGRRTVLAALLASLSASAYAEPANVVISQVYGGGGNAGATFRHDFIEIFNRSGSAVAIGGWSVQYASSGGSTWQVTAIPDGVELQPGQYYMIREVAGTGGTTDVPFDIQAGIAMSGTAGKVALVSAKTALSGTNPTGATVVDLVGFGTAANGFEGTAPTATLSNTTSASRKTGGCVDTDSNSGDFTVGAVSPRKSDSTFNVCGGGVPIAEPIVATCPASILRPYGDSASGALSAIDKDSRVTGAVITSATIAGIRLENFSASGAINSAASVTLVADASVAPGNHPVTINFTNDANQFKSCTVTVRSSGNLAIPVIQGAGAASTYADTIQTTEGVITAKVGSGYFIQDAAGDNDPTTSDGIFVFGSTAGKVGDLVRVTGQVTEYQPSGTTSTYTELTNTTSSLIGAGPAISATNIALPAASLEPFEGMLVRFTNALTVNQNAYVGARGELTLSSGRREIPTNRYRPGTPEALALAASNANNQIVLDDGLFVTPATIPYIGVDGTVRTGDTVTGLEGVLDFGALGGGGAGFKLQPTMAPVFSRTNPRTGAPVLPAGVKVASANVLNFFTTFVDGSNVEGATGQGCTIGSTTRASNCRGANNMIEFVRQRDKIVKSLAALNADVVGLMEIQNNGDTAVSSLVASLNVSLGGPVYAVVPKPPATGTDAIRVAMIYKPAAVTLAGASMSDGDGVNNRPPMAQTFKATNGAKFSVIVNHLKAKAGCPGGSGVDTDRGDGQGCWNATRREQAERLATFFIPQVKASAGDDDVLVIGDMNAYGFEDPIAYLTGTGLVNELERFVRPHGMAYSYVFGGQSGYLDHALTTPSLSAQVAGAAEWHNNADEPEVIDYNLEDKPQDLYADNAYRASDHDPVIVSLALAPVVADVTASVKVLQSGLTMNRATLKYTGKVTFTNTSAAPLAGPLHFVLQGLTAGVSLDAASGTHEGAPYLTLPAGLAPGASVTLTTVFSNPSKSAIGYTPKLLSGTL
ncbi:ExeM/NucH family extracellular endonuclease [Telluria aromaticivorans]|uniref:ExeM/NucH family extracellular endonuclease n=1 Tax=Telluria aromaticivorans TaxID=2725995 RepID=A0A7Y2JZC7_9BURK|nr:ExeM/NucH family extracellular endonuclease [Telluria aromaticivorans]NNG23790.1 ExeM/NucH family extracellular endonuclease [Telluria aromaticivorans]